MVFKITLFFKCMSAHLKYNPRKLEIKIKKNQNEKYYIDRFYGCRKG